MNHQDNINYLVNDILGVIIVNLINEEKNVSIRNLGIQLHEVKKTVFIYSFSF